VGFLLTIFAKIEDPKTGVTPIADDVRGLKIRATPYIKNMGIAPDRKN